MEECCKIPLPAGEEVLRHIWQTIKLEVETIVIMLVELWLILMILGVLFASIYLLK